MFRFDADPMLRRLERSALVFCAASAVVALGVRRGHPDVALGVLGGGVLTGVSYWAIRSGIDSLVRAVALRPPTGAPTGGAGAGTGEAPAVQPEPDESGRRRDEHDSAGAPAGGPGTAAGVARLVGRYALLGLLAYVMIARLRLHPVGLLIGVSSLAVAASLEAVRATAGAGRGRPRA